MGRICQRLRDNGGRLAVSRCGWARLVTVPADLLVGAADLHLEHQRRLRQMRRRAIGRVALRACSAEPRAFGRRSRASTAVFPAAASCACTVNPSGVKAGSFPSAGSTSSDVRWPSGPRSRQNSL